MRPLHGDGAAPTPSSPVVAGRSAAVPARRAVGGQGARRSLCPCPASPSRVRLPIDRLLDQSAGGMVSPQRRKHYTVLRHRLSALGISVFTLRFTHLRRADLIITISQTDIQHKHFVINQKH